MNGLIDKSLLAARLLIVIGIGYSLAQGIRLLVDPPRILPDSEPELAQSRGSASPAVDLRQLASLHLFGEALAEPANDGLADVDAPDTSLRLELQGVFRSVVEKLSTAIIAERGKPAQLYRIDDRLPGNAVLAAVFEDRVLLQRGGRYETLRFPQDRNAAGKGEIREVKSATRPVLAEAARRAPDTAQFSPEVEAAPADSPLGEIRDLTLSQLVEKYSDELEDDPDELLSDFGLVPSDDGYRIGNQLPSEVLRQAGLRPGDVIIAVNEIPVADIRRNQSRINDIISSGRAEVQFRRGERNFVVTTPVK